MKISCILSYLVTPRKHNPAAEEIKGTRLPLKGRLCDMLSRIYEKSDTECHIPIRFLMARDGSQENNIRTQILALAQEPHLASGRQLAAQLQEVTTEKSGLGLLFFIFGQNGSSRKFLISRFPANHGIIAEANQASLQVEFIERVFMKSTTNYKAALYTGRSFDSDFWDGMAIDKQADPAQGHLATYWIKDFLASDFKTTAKTGTKRLGVTLRAALEKAPSLTVKEEIVAAATLARGLSGQPTSINALVRQFSLSEEAKATIEDQVANKRLLDDTFVLDAEEFSKHTSFKSVQLHHGAILTAPAERFDECFEQEVVDVTSAEYRFCTTGRIIDERVRGNT